MDSRLDNYDWAEVFGEGDGGNCTPIIPQPALPDQQISLATFYREDVVEIYQMLDGERDESEWIIYGKLKDGRFFAARGGCDYTGWDCQADNSGNVASSKKQCINFCLTDEERARFGLPNLSNEAK